MKLDRDTEAFCIAASIGIIFAIAWFGPYGPIQRRHRNVVKAIQEVHKVHKVQKCIKL